MRPLTGLMRQHMKYSHGKYVPKRAFATKEAAMHSHALQADPRLVAYQCDVCNRWHLGHP